MRRTEAIAIVLVALGAFAAALVGLDARATYGARVTADEPQYLLTAQSLVDDGSLDISDEIADRAYLPYHEITIDRQTTVLDDGSEISPHDPLLPVVLALPMWIGGWVAAKATLALIGGATAALATWIAIRRFGVGPPAAGVTIAATFVGLPLASYGTQVYPEMPAALATLVAFAAITSPTTRLRRVVTACLAIVALPWLAVKYAPVAAALAVGLLATVSGRRRRVAVAGALAVAGAVYLGLHRLWYGGWTVYSTGDHFEETGEFSVVGTRVDVIGRSRRIVGLLVDRDFGIAAWSPVWLLLPVAAAVLVRHRGPWRWLWLATVVAGWLNATFVALTMHGWWVPGRQIVVILPLAAVGIAWLVERARWLVVPVAIAGVLGAVNWVWLAIESSTGRRTLVIDFAATAAVPYRWWRSVLPAGLGGGSADGLLLAVWAVAIGAAMAIGARSVTRRSTDRPGSPRAAPG